MKYNDDFQSRTRVSLQETGEARHKFTGYNNINSQMRKKNRAKVINSSALIILYLPTVLASI